MHAEFVRSLHKSEQEVRQKPDGDQEAKNGATGSPYSFEFGFSVHVKLHRLTKAIERGKVVKKAFFRLLARSFGV